MNRQILVPMDDSEPATHALETALELFPNAAVTVLHVLDPNEIFRYADADLRPEDAANIERAERDRREAAETLLEEARSRVAGRGRDVETVLKRGKPGSTIVAYAEDHDVDHIVIGSHGRTGVSRILLGSIAESVARRAPTPVTIVR